MGLYNPAEPAFTPPPKKRKRKQWGTDSVRTQLSLKPADLVVVVVFLVGFEVGKGRERAMQRVSVCRDVRQVIGTVQTPMHIVVSYDYAAFRHNHAANHRAVRTSSTARPERRPGRVVPG